jgi:capsular polysaccharide biosynthesis protein
MDNQKIANISIVETALPPGIPINSYITIKIVLSMILGLSSGLVMAFSIEYFNHTFNHREDIEKRLDLPVLAAIPDIMK